MSEQTTLEMRMVHVSQDERIVHENPWLDENLAEKDLLDVQKANTGMQHNSISNLTSKGTNDEHQDITLEHHGNDRHIVLGDNDNDDDIVSGDDDINKDSVPDDHQTEHGVAAEDPHHEYDTVPDDHQTEYGVVTEDYYHEYDTVPDDHQTEYGVVAVDPHHEYDTVPDDHQTEHGVAAEDYHHEYDTVSDDHQTEYGVVAEDYHHEYDTVSDDHQTEHGVVAEDYHHEYDTVSDDHRTEYGVVAEDPHHEYDTVPDDHQTEYGVAAEDYHHEYDTVSDDHRTEYGVVAEDPHHEYDTVPDDHQTEYGVVAVDPHHEYDTVSDDHQTEYGVVAVDPHHEYDTVSDDHQTEYGVVTEDYHHEYDTVSDNHNSVCAYYVTDEGDIALPFMKFFSCIGRSKSKDKETTPLQKSTKDKAKEQPIDPSRQTQLKPLGTIYERGVKPRQPYIQTARKGGGHSSDIIGGRPIRDSTGIPTQFQEAKHGNVNTENERHISLLKRPVGQTFERNHPANISAVSHDTHVHDLDTYDFSFPHRGYAVLIVNKWFENFSTRDGAECDVTKSRDILKKLGYCQINDECKNLDKISTLEILEAARDTDHSLFDSFALVFSSHGDEKENPRKNGKKEHAIYCSDDQYIFTGDILEMFSDENCPSLKGKPKLFFIQACRGSKTDLGVEIVVMEVNDCNPNNVKHVTVTQPNVRHNNSFISYYDGKTPEGETVEPVINFESDPLLGRVQSVDDTDAGGFADIWEDKPIVHCNNDCLVMYAIPSGHFAWRSNKDGSWMLHYLWEEVMNYDYRKPCSFLKVLTATNRKMANRETIVPGNPAKSGKKAIPAIIHQLDKDIVFRQKKCRDYAKITFV